MDLVEDILDGTLRKDGFPIIETEKHNAKIEPVGGKGTLDGLEGVEDFIEMICREYQGPYLQQPQH